MGIKIRMNPKYGKLRDFIGQLPDCFDREGRIIHDGRNKLKVFDVDGLEINVKRYRIPIFINRLIYTFIRKPKGVRAFEYPARLEKAGIETPEPIAYIQENRSGLIRYSYFVSVQSPYPNDMYHFGEEDADSCRDFIEAFAREMARCHEAGILHRDLSPGNILYDKIDGEYKFTVVDINRMGFGKVDVRTGCLNFARLWGQPRFFRILAEEYAKARHADADQCVQWIKEGRMKYMSKFDKPSDIGYDAKI